MKLLLDSHIAIWMVTASARLSVEGFDFITDSRNSIFVSAVTIWEIAIKSALQKKKSAFPFSSSEAIDYFHDAGFSLLDITPAHAAYVEKLPLLHGDPFDRLLVAQAMSEPMRLLTADAAVAAYSDIVILLK